MIKQVGKIQIAPVINLVNDRERAIYELGVMIERLTMYKYFTDTPDKEVVRAIQEKILDLQMSLS